MAKSKLMRHVSDLVARPRSDSNGCNETLDQLYIK